MNSAFVVLTQALFWVAVLFGVAGVAHELYLLKFDAKSLEPKFAVPGVRSTILHD